MSKSDAAAIFDWLTREQDLEVALRSLDAASLRGLYKWLVKRNDAGGVPLLIRGLCEAEASKRFMEGGEA